MRASPDPCRVRGGRVSSIQRARQLTNADDVELETTLQQLLLNLRSDAVETDVALGEDGGRGSSGHCVCRCTGCLSGEKRVGV